MRIYLLLLLLGSIVSLKSIKDFWTSFFNSIKQGFYDVRLATFLSTTQNPGNRLVSLTDLNNDKYTDLVMLDDTGSVVRVYLFDEPSA